MNIITKIEKLGITDKRLKIDEAIFNTKNDELTINFIYNEDFPLTDVEKQSINEIVLGDLADFCAVSTKFNKSCFDAEVIFGRVEEYIEKNYKVLKNEIKRDDIKLSQSSETKVVELVICCDDLRRQIFVNKGFDAELAEFLMRKFFMPFEVKFEVTREMASIDELRESMPEIDTSLSDCLAKEDQINQMEADVGECFYGKYMGENPEFISKINRDAGSEVLVAGVVTGLQLSSYMSKTKLDGQPIEKKKLSFTLTDPSGSIGVVVFPQEKAMQQLEIIEEGMTIAVGGSISDFKGSVNLRANSISKCEIFTKELKRVYREVNENYHFVKPQPVTETQQMDLFSATQKATDYWETHDSVVVFDLETTGFNASSCKIIEIGAVKIIKGSIVETFQTLINPEVEIPAEITNLTHIDDSMVADAPLIEQALPDFYKFAYGSVLSAYNIDFDYQFLDFNGQNIRLLFNNEQIDTLRLVRDKVPSLSNYKLGTVVKALNITLNNAHRALADAYATAKVFVKLI